MDIMCRIVMRVANAIFNLKTNQKSSLFVAKPLSLCVHFIIHVVCSHRFAYKVKNVWDMFCKQFQIQKKNRVPIPKQKEAQEAILFCG